MLFKPFELRRWFVIGFCAWLAYLGSGGPGGGGGPSYGVPAEPDEIGPQIREVVDAAEAYISDNLYWLAPIAVIAVVLVVVLVLLIAWLNSRGKFMFLHCVATNKAEVRVPLHKFRQQGNSLFLFRIVLGIISFVVVVVPLIGIVVLVVMMVCGTAPGIVSIPGIIMLGLTIFALSILLFLVTKFTFDFVVPIMFLRMASCTSGWREFMTILSANKLRFTLYLLFQIVIEIVIGAIVAIGFCIGLCFCCASCMLLIPYIGTVILLPLLVFERGYSLYYLQQFGPDFDVFRAEIETAQSA
jgi:hypothetical protein